MVSSTILPAASLAAITLTVSPVTPPYTTCARSKRRGARVGTATKSVFQRSGVPFTAIVDLPEYERTTTGRLWK